MGKSTRLNTSYFLRLLGFLFVSLLLWTAISDFYLRTPATGEILGKYSITWAVVFLSWLGFCSIVCILSGFVLIKGKFPDLINKLLNWIRLRRRLAAVIAGLVLTVPIFILLWTRLGDYLTTPIIRLVILLVSGLGTSIIISHHHDSLADWHEVAFGILAAAGLYYAALQIASVTNHPFSLGWSEGNRLYDYSLIFGSNRYHSINEITLRKDIGRQFLWGLPFLIPETQIWLHRFWNAFLSTVPAFILGIVLSGWSHLGPLKRWTLALWFFLFLSQGPIYTPLTLSALVAVLFIARGKWFLSAGAAGLAGFYASLSRFTWLPAVPIWAGFLLLDAEDFQLTSPSKAQQTSIHAALHLLRQLIPIFLVMLFGLVGGLLANPTLFQPKTLVGSTSFAQPLLWYRLFPNATYSEGILGGLLLACGPLIAILVWQAVSKKWKLNWLQATYYLGASFILMAGGLIASVKIGGGNNLHNLDMFFISIAILCGLALKANHDFFNQNWPFLWRVMLALAIFVPAWSAYRSGTRLVLPDLEKQQKALSVLQEKVEQASQQGYVLFMDQRQLLTFGIIRDIELIPEYEKKYVMDQAMAANQEFFQNFYQDLAEKRFSLIITDPLFTKIKEGDFVFSEENNAWVRWVARPLLCYYAPIKNIPENILGQYKIQLLVPRQNPKDCP